MKAWRCINDFEGYITIVFAETAGKARYIAMQNGSIGDDLEFRDVTVRREKAMDKNYRGRTEMDWYNADDRIAMVKDGGMYCDDDSFDTDYCKRCSAAEYCDKYQDYLNESKR